MKIKASDFVIENKGCTSLGGLVECRQRYYMKNKKMTTKIVNELVAYLTSSFKKLNVKICVRGLNQYSGYRSIKGFNEDKTNLLDDQQYYLSKVEDNTKFTKWDYIEIISVGDPQDFSNKNKSKTKSKK